MAACLARTAGRRGDPAALAEAVVRWERLDTRFERACTGHHVLVVLGGRGNITSNVIRAVGAPHEPVESRERMEVVEYMEVLSDVRRLSRRR